MSQTLNQLLNEAIVAYAELVKLDPETRWWGEDGDILKSINESRELDPSGVTTYLLIQGHLDTFLANESFSAKDIFENPEQFKQRLDYLSRVRHIVLHADTMGPREQFKEHVRQLGRATGYTKMAELEESLADPTELATLRWSALRSAKNLEAFQFTHGDPDELPLGVNHTIFEFWNVNSLLKLLQMQGIPGTTLCLIRDPAEVLASFFVFAIKNGDIITVLTDRDKTPHPLHWQMSRSAGRSRKFEAKVLAHWFPYHLLEDDIEEDANGVKHGKKRTALVQQQTKMIPLTKLTELDPPYFIWAMLTMELLSQDFQQRQRRRRQLGYTGEMVKHPEALVSPGSAVMKKGYTPLALPPLTRNDVTREAVLTIGKVKRKPTGFNDWLVERHKDQVPEEVFNILGDGERKLLESKHGKLMPRDRDGDRDRLELHAMSPIVFGTREELEADRLWLARKNQAEIIDALARAEYEKELPGVLRWLEERINTRQATFVEYAAKGRWDATFRLVDRMTWASEFHSASGSLLTRQLWPTDRKDFGNAYFGGYRNYGQFVLGRLDETRSFYYRCAVNDAATAHCFTTFEPECPESLATLLGVAVTDLPIWLQHWYTSEPYDGNPILDRLDPSDWAIKNRWHEHLRIKVCIALSRKAFNAERERLGLPRSKEAPIAEKAKRPLVIKFGGRK